MDVTQLDQVKKLVDSAVNQFGRIDVILNNALTACMNQSNGYRLPSSNGNQMRRSSRLTSCLIKFKVWALLTLIFTISTFKNMSALQSNKGLDAKEQSIVTIAAFTANGDSEKLKSALNSGLDAGLTINEIKEILVQLYAYCGFPRSLNGINTFIAVLDERKTKGIQDPAGAEGKQVEGGDKYEQGKKTLEELSGLPQSGPLTGISAFAPGIDVFLKEHLFADIFGRGVLTYKQRELATISVLATLPGLGGQLQFHIGAGMHVGLTEVQLQNLISILDRSIGKTQAEAAQAVLNQVIAAKK